MKPDLLDWDVLDRELNQWAADGLTATFWWRDDDASRDSDQLARLLELTASSQTPVSLAVVPDWLTDTLPNSIAQFPHVSVLQHGYAHRSHAGSGARKSEFADNRDVSDMRTEIISGEQILRDNFGGQFLPVMVPPWNRYGGALRSLFIELEFTGLSAMWASDPAQSRYPLRQVNTHIDPIAWRGDRGYAGADVVLEQLISHLRLRREISACLAEPTGLLTHHLDHTPDVWNFCEQFVHRLSAHSCVQWVSAAQIWSPRQ